MPTITESTAPPPPELQAAHAAAQSRQTKRVANRARLMVIGQALWDEMKHGGTAVPTATLKEALGRLILEESFEDP